ncbi:FAD-binding domain-containing protein [Periconia macrospinosa]|uniref:FAD-binding domain-containing protein n=1 Tax=Periconia macrospinosa TaxID=97972 RepID=A0A2V1DH29_9PLEO|nr:FAD-binding domain-containing protein [Periconia macrospinosa]
MSSSKINELFDHKGLQKKVLRPDDAEYKARQESFWSLYSKVEPACIVCPTSASEVSTILKTLIDAGQQFAVRSGGHTQWTGANNIQGGVTIDLQHLNSVKFDKDTNTVDIGPGARWKEVYAELETHGRVVAGGRNGKVGVGGLLLGGGMSFFTGSRGLACEDVLSYEVVLADGRTVTADANNNYQDLYLALKGGSGNFGIVTNFKMQTFVREKIWGGLRILSKDNTDAALQALENFVPRASVDVDSNLLLFIAYMPEQKDVVVIEALVQVGAEENASTYDQLLAIPSVMDMCKMTTVKELVSQYDPVPSGYYNCYYTLSLKNDIRIFRKAAQLHEQLVEDLKVIVPEGNFLTECLFQPLPMKIGRRSAERGGNIMGVSEQPEDGVLWVAIAIVEKPEQEKLAYPKLQAWGEAVREYASSIDNGLLPWVYMNYADKSQQPLASYGEENVKKLKDVAARYDPGEVFQKLCPGGFKVSDVNL